MDKWFFIEVQTYLSVNNMGRELGQYVCQKYDQVVVHNDCIDDIEADIKSKMDELTQKYPRCKPFKYMTRRYRDRYQVGVPEISVKPDNPYNDNYVFVLSAKYIRKLNLETTWTEQ